MSGPGGLPQLSVRLKVRVWADNGGLVDLVLTPETYKLVGGAARTLTGGTSRVDPSPVRRSPGRSRGRPASPWLTSCLRAPSFSLEGYGRPIFYFCFSERNRVSVLLLRHPSSSSECQGGDGDSETSSLLGRDSSS